MPNVTLKDIAKVSGLSVSTVSRLLNDKYDAKSAKAKKVIRIAKKLGYQPNHAAVMLKTNSSKILGVIVPFIDDGFFATILQGIESELKKYGFRVVICQTNDSSKEEEEAIRQLTQFKVDGIIISLSKNSQNLDLLASLNNSSTRVLQIDRVVKYEHVPSLELQDEKATGLAMKTLLTFGLKSFLYIGLSPDISNDQSRYSGFQNELDESCSFKKYYPESIEDQQLLEQIGAVDCILCYNDAIAVEVLISLKKLGISVPKRISVLGFDDRPFCEWLTPSLSSINRPIKQLGINAAQHILKDINKQLVLNEIKLDPPKLILRESVKVK